MNLYYFIFVWILFMVVFSTGIKVTYKTEFQGKTVERWYFVYALLAFAPVIYLVAFTAPRSDTVLYLSSYRNLPMTWSEISERLSADDSGRGFIIFQWVIKRIFGGSETAFRVLLAFIHSIPVLYIYRKYSNNFLLSLFLFIAGGCHIGWMMNGLRQFLAVSIIMAATPLMLKKKYVPLIAVILLATTIHSSAIVMLPVVFIVQGKPWNKRTVLFIILSVVMMYAFSKNVNLMDNMLAGTEYEGTMASALEMGDDGTNPIRVLVNSVPMLLALTGRKQLEGKSNAVIDLCINMSVITSGIYLISMVTSGIMIGRLPIYTSLYSYILLPYLLDNVFSVRSHKLTLLSMVSLYMAYYLYGYRGF